MRIAREYGERLKSKLLKPGALERLVQDYPSHGFVIDKEEALQYFTNIEDLGADETRLAQFLDDYVRWPKEDPEVFDVRTFFESIRDLENKRAQAAAQAAAAQAAQTATAKAGAGATGDEANPSNAPQGETGNGAQGDGGGSGTEATQPAGPGVNVATA